MSANLNPNLQYGYITLGDGTHRQLVSGWKRVIVGLLQLVLRSIAWLLVFILVGGVTILEERLEASAVGQAALSGVALGVMTTACWLLYIRAVHLPAFLQHSASFVAVFGTVWLMGQTEIVGWTSGMSTGILGLLLWVTMLSDLPQEIRHCIIRAYSFLCWIIPLAFALIFLSYFLGVRIAPAIKDVKILGVPFGDDAVGIVVAAIVALVLVIVPIQWKCVRLIGTNGSTPIMERFNFEIVCINSGTPIGVRRATVRMLTLMFYSVLFVVFLRPWKIPYDIMMDDSRRGVHDNEAMTVVVTR